ncbi:MAG: peptidoglycan editing factor PgeF [Gammaproteobacteria bacterium]
MTGGSGTLADAWLCPAWAAPSNVHLRVTTRHGNFSEPPYDGFNLALHVGDDPAAVQANRRRLQQAIGLPRQPLWLEQVHGVVVVDAAAVDPSAPPPVADAAFTRQPGVACVVMTADCLPVALAARDGSVVGVAHAGWKGLCLGVIEALVEAMAVPGEELLAWLGPAIGPAAYETGPEVRDAFVARDPDAAAAFVAVTRSDGTLGFLCDLCALARQRLAALGVTAVSGGDLCTKTDSERFYSFRRTPVTGRFATLVWRD